MWQALCYLPELIIYAISVLGSILLGRTIYAPHILICDDTPQLPEVGHQVLADVPGVEAKPVLSCIPVLHNA